VKCASQAAPNSAHGAVPQKERWHSLDFSMRLRPNENVRLSVPNFYFRIKGIALGLRGMLQNCRTCL
jgi:hypothetical protein